MQFAKSYSTYESALMTKSFLRAVVRDDNYFQPCSNKNNAYDTNWLAELGLLNFRLTVPSTAQCLANSYDSTWLR